MFSELLTAFDHDFSLSGSFCFLNPAALSLSTTVFESEFLLENSVITLSFKRHAKIYTPWVVHAVGSTRGRHMQHRNQSLALSSTRYLELWNNLKKKTRSILKSNPMIRKADLFKSPKKADLI